MPGQRNVELADPAPDVCQPYADRDGGFAKAHCRQVNDVSILPAGHRICIDSPRGLLSSSATLVDAIAAVVTVLRRFARRGGMSAVAGCPVATPRGPRDIARTPAHEQAPLRRPVRQSHVQRPGEKEGELIEFPLATLGTLHTMTIEARKSLSSNRPDGDSRQGTPVELRR